MSLASNDVLTEAQRKRFGMLIRIARMEAGMRQADLAEAMGVSITAVSQWERGVKRDFSRVECATLEEALGLKDRRLLLELGYEKGEYSYRPLTYPGPKLTSDQEAEVLRIVQLFQQHPSTRR